MVAFRASNALEAVKSGEYLFVRADGEASWERADAVNISSPQ